MKNVVTIGVGALALLGGLFLYNSAKKRIQIPRQKVLELLKQLKEEMYIPLLEISSWANQNASKASPDMLRQLLKSEESPFYHLIKQKEAKVFTDISKEDFEDNIQNHYRKDIQIQYLLKQLQEEFQKAIMGVIPELKDTNIVFMTQEKLLSIIEDLLTSHLTRLKSKIVSNMPPRQVIEIIEKEQNQGKLYRQQKLKQLGLTSNPKIVNDIYEFSIAKYIRMSPQFQTKYKQLVQKHQQQKEAWLTSYVQNQYGRKIE